MKNMIIASTLRVYGQEYLEFIEEEVVNLFKGVDEVLFIPYARPSGISYEEYTASVSSKFRLLGITIKGIHEFQNEFEAVEFAKGIFVGGGNTFELVNQLHRRELMSYLKKAVEFGIPYLGSSAGSNIVGVNMKTTNDMPVVYPPSFDTLNLVHFNINAHYIDSDPNSTHMGETRDMRIKEFLKFNETPVVALKEGSWIRVKGLKINLKGELKGKLFENSDRDPIDLLPNSDLSFLMN